MKKLYAILGLCAVFAAPSFAQEEEDVTHFIVNPGFDDELTFNEDGSTKELVERDTKLSNRSYKWVAADGTIYAGTVTDSSNPSWKRNDTNYSVNGFLGQIKGWTLNTGSNGEWTYFGALPYSLDPTSTAVGIADDNNGSWLTVAGKPEEADTEDNKGTMYLRAGWTNYATYSQVVNLPCAQYRLEYWINNMNFAGTNPDGLENLCKIICRDDVFPDEEGVNADGWTKHTIEFTPTSEFTIQMGFKAANRGSGTNPILLIDGLKLYKIGEADREQLLQSDIMHYVDLLTEYADENFSENTGIAEEIQGKAEEYSDATAEGDLEAMEKIFKEAKDYYENNLPAVLENVNTLNSLIEKAEGLLESEELYPGANDLNSAIGDAQAKAAEGNSEDVAKAIDDLNKAIDDYYMSQEATPENPANFTFYIDNPTFEAQGKWYIGEGGGDQVIKTDKTDNEGNTINCWNAWRNNLEVGNSVSVNQDLTGLRNGKYTLTADINTQDGCITDQHLFANGTADSGVSPVMTVTGWNPCVWETLTTAPVIVVDGKLTIGAIGHGDGLIPADFGGTDTDKRRGWFNLTNVKLNYLGEATAEEIAAVTAAKYTAAEELAESMHFAADKETYKQAIADAKANNDLEALNAATSVAEASENEYNGIIAGTYAALQDSIANNANYSATVKQVTKVPVDYMTNFLGSADATYTDGAAITPILRKYRDDLNPTIIAAEKMEIKDAAAKTLVANAIAEAVSTLSSYVSETSVIDGCIAKIKDAMALAELSDYEYAAGKDATVYMKNPEISSTTGWTLVIEESGNGLTTNKGQGYTGDGNDVYLDSWNGTPALLKVKDSQVMDVPNGTYEISALMRTTGEGFFLYAASGDNTVKAEATMNTADYKGWMKPTLDEETSEYSYSYNADQYGDVWFEAAKKIKETMGLVDADENSSLFDIAVDKNEGNTTCPEGIDATDWAIFSANNGIGRGWMKRTVTIEVKNHTLEVGVATADAFEEGAQFTGTWLSADHFTLTLTKVGDNANWSPAATDVKAVESTDAVVSSVYSISGARVAGIQKGLNIVKYSDGSVKKIMVK